MSRILFFLAWAPLVYSAEPPALKNPDRPILREPVYLSKSPQYGALLIGSVSPTRFWFVHDGDHLYFDRNGNGDLTEPGEKIARKDTKRRDPENDYFQFEVGDLQVGGLTHKSLIVSIDRLAKYTGGETGDRPEVKAILAKDPKALVASIRGAIQVPGIPGGGIGKRVGFSAGPFDGYGVMQLANSPDKAPVVHFGGPLQVTFYGLIRPLQIGVEDELSLVVGTPGKGPGTFAMVAYQDTIPEAANPVAEIVFPPGSPGASPIKEKLILKSRC